MTTTKESLEQIKKYLCAGNPIWDVDKVAAVMDEAIAAVEKQTAKKPEPLTDAEQRIFIEAMWREKDVCMAVDKEFPDAKVNLTDVCREIVRKVRGALWA